MPPDEGHPYGHGKIEYFSAGFEGALIILAAIGIFKTGVDHLIHPRHLPNLGEGLLLLVGAYGGLAEVLMSGYPVEIASECLQEAAGRAFRNAGIKEVERYWLEVTAVKPE